MLHVTAGGLRPFHANGLYERLNELRRQITESRPKWPAIRVLLLPGALHNSTRVAKPVKRFRISGAATDLLGEKESSKEPESFVPQLTNS